MRIIMPTFERIEWMPPTINLLKKLNDLGHEVVCITIYPSDYLKKMNLKNVINVSLASKEICLQYKIPYVRGISGILFRIDTLFKKLFCIRLKKIIEQELRKGGYLWVVNEMTVMLAGRSFLKNKRYAFTVYELHEKLFYSRNIEFAARGADIVVVPEYCRAHIMQSRYELKKTPIVLPNKSDISYNLSDISETGKESIRKIEKLKNAGKTVVLYMGGITTERPLEYFIENIRGNHDFVLAILGRETAYLKKMMRSYGENVVYLGAFNPPEHLAVASYTDIGLLNYVSINQKQGLNALFCAPNKIFEYTGLGLPVIGNDIPGLRFEIEKNNCGLVVDYSNSKSLNEALTKIIADYETFSDNAIRYYNSVNIDEILNNILGKMERSVI